MVIRGDTIIYVGDDDGARRPRPAPPEIDLRRPAARRPAFVDAHLHAVQAGLVMTGLDLHGVRQPRPSCWTGWPRYAAAPAGRR